MRKLTPILLSLSLMGGIACATNSSEKTTGQSEGQRLAYLAFTSVDENGDGEIDLGEMEKQRRSVLHSQDSNDNGVIELQEFLAWDYGFQNLAKDKNREHAYVTALKLVHHFRDRDGNGSISNTEHRLATIADFNRADDNHDAILTREEFANGFSILAAIRVALKDNA